MAQHDSQTPLDSRDLWATPQWLFDWLNDQYNFDIDLAANAENAKCENYLTEEDNSLKVDWMDLAMTIPLNDIDRPIGFLNPPYSKTAPWIEKAPREMEDGFSSVHVIPMPNGENQYVTVFERATKIIFIHGRISFEASCDYEKTVKIKGKPDKIVKIKKGDCIGGNTRGTCIVEFLHNPQPFDIPQQILHVRRDEIMDIYDL